MRLIGIDFGRAKIGVAYCESSIAEPLAVLRGRDLLNKTVTLIKHYSPDVVVVGVSENRSALESRKFASKLEAIIGVKTVLEDETLSTHQAQSLSRAQNINRSRRYKMEDAFAATIVLQSYVDKYV